MNTTNKRIVVLGVGLTVAGGILAGIVTYDLDYTLLGENHSGSASGTNSICLAYINTVGDNASDLVSSIASATSVTPACVLKFDPSEDAHIRHLSGAAPSQGHPCYLDNENVIATEDFDLVAGEGYRVVMDSGGSMTYTMTGDEDADLSIVLFKKDETTPEGPSNSGFNDYCPPYNRVVDNASTLWAEIECPLGTCSEGVCTENDGQSCLAGCTPCITDAACSTGPPQETCLASGFCSVGGGSPCNQSCEPCDNDGQCDGAETCDKTAQMCQDGANDGDFCNRVSSISRFVRSSDALVTYSGTLLANDFSLASGESYRIQVKRHVDYVPGSIRGVTAYVESQRPAPCGVQDGGLLVIGNKGSALVDVSWHGGDDARETPPSAADGYTNLVFVPTGRPALPAGVPATTCGSSTDPGECQLACPVQSDDDAGCEEIGPGCDECGCEIIDGVAGFCAGTFPGSPPDPEYISCDETVCPGSSCPCPAGTTCRLPYVLPEVSAVRSCNQVLCDGSLSCGYDEGRCCDQAFGFSEAGTKCSDPSWVFCTELQNANDAVFALERVSIDGGSTWLDEADLESRGVLIEDFGSEQTIEHRNCCDFYCADGAGSLVEPCIPCQADTVCTNVDSTYSCSISACDDRSCEDAPSTACDSPNDCPDFGRCVHACD